MMKDVTLRNEGTKHITVPDIIVPRRRCDLV